MVKFAVLVTSLAQPGGAERTVLIQLRYSDPSRMQCAGIALSGRGGLDEELGRELLKYTTIHGQEPWGPWWRSREAAAMVKTDYPSLKAAVNHVCQEADALIIVNWVSPQMADYTTGLKIPVICVSHCSVAYAKQMTGVTHLVAVSEAARALFAGVPGSEGLPVTIIPNGVEIDRVCPRRGRAWQRAQWGVSDSDKVLLYLGRQHRDKNPCASIQALAKLPLKYKLVMIGNQAHVPDQPHPDVIKAIDELGVQDRVQLLPPISFVGDALAGADCMLHLSVSEGDSLVVKEAFMASLPVVHTRTGSIPEMEAEFGPVGWGINFRPGELGPESVDPAEVADQVEMAIAFAKSVTCKMRAIAWEHWTGPAVCERWANYLEGVVAT